MKTKMLLLDASGNLTNEYVYLTFIIFIRPSKGKYNQ